MRLIKEAGARASRCLAICATKPSAANLSKMRSAYSADWTLSSAMPDVSKTHDSILDISSEDFDATMKTNIYAPFWIIKAALALLRPGAVIIATTSEQAYDPSPDLYDYAQDQSSDDELVKSLAKQLGPKGIRVNGVAPGPIWTPLQVSGGATMEKLEQFGGHAPLGRAGQPAELASIYVQLAAERCELCHRPSVWSGGRRRPARRRQLRYIASLDRWVFRGKTPIDHRSALNSERAHHARFWMTVDVFEILSARMRRRTLRDKAPAL